MSWLNCHSPIAASAAAEHRLTARCHRASKRSRSQATPVAKISHHNAEPTNTPSTITQGDGTGAPPANAPNTAMNERMVVGLDSVKKNVPDT